MRDRYVKSTNEFKPGPDQLLRLRKRLYGLSDSGDYWHVTFANNLRADLGMTFRAEASTSAGEVGIETLCNVYSFLYRMGLVALP